MYLKRIEIQGFKSFADTSVIEFKKPSSGRHPITAIVGPNGSGKSNISDAIRWVLGEQSMKQLRGKKSEDIIFAGSEGKGRMSMARVSLVLDNHDGRIPLEYDEIVISRTLYRSGESEYAVNGNAVRLFDLQVLLAQAQFGHGSYSVIGQGTIDKLLLQTPHERKDFFDEAVGIKEFQIKRRHAMLKLKRTEDNMNQATLLLQEVAPRLKSLKRQVKKLEERQEVERSLREVQELYYVTLHQDISQRITSLQSNFDEKNKIYDTVYQELCAVQTELASLAQEKSHREQFQTLQQEYNTIQQEKNNAERELASFQGRMQGEYRKAGKDHVAWLEQKITSHKSQEESLRHDIGLLEYEYQKKKTIYDTLIQEREDVEKKLLQLHNQEQQLLERTREQSQQQDVVQYGALRAVQAILVKNHEFGGRLYGMVAQLAHVDEKFRVALEVAAQSHLSSLVVENDSVAERCIAYLKEYQLGFATFLPLNTIRERAIAHDIYTIKESAGVYGLATELIEYDNNFARIFSYVFGSTLIVEDIVVARRIGIGRVRMVTLEGDILETSGSLKGGFRRMRRGALSFGGQAFSHDEEDIEKNRTEIVQERQRCEEKQRVLIQHIATVQSDFEIEQKTIILHETQLQTLAKERASFEQELSMNDMSSDEYSDVMKTLSSQTKDVETRIVELSTRMHEVETQMATLHDDEEQKRQRVFLLQNTLQTTQHTLNNASDEKHAIALDITKLQTHRQGMEQEIYNELHSDIASVVERVSDSIPAHEVEAMKVRIEKMKYTLSLIGGIDEAVCGEYEEIRVRHDELDIQLADLSNAKNDLEKMIAELDSLMKKKHAEYFKKIKKEFSRYFSVLFDGGKAELIELYGSDADNSEEEIDEYNEDKQDHIEKKRHKKILQGIDVQACPPGKKIHNINALSGGERTLTSIALVCAILHTNPSPFVLLDEVEAALDEANTERFSNILGELARQSQFIIITHNRVTMHASDTLYGVTMGGDGMSKLVSVELDK